jgi:RHS repeat-associated protein
MISRHFHGKISAAVLLLLSGFSQFLMADATNDGSPPPTQPDPPPCGCEGNVGGSSCTKINSLSWGMQVGSNRPSYPALQDIFKGSSRFGFDRSYSGGIPMKSAGGGGGGGGGGTKIKFGIGGSKGFPTSPAASGFDALDNMLAKYINRQPVDMSPVMLQINSPSIYNVSRLSLDVSTNSETANYRVVRTAIPPVTFDGHPVPPGIRIGPIAVNSNGQVVSQEFLDSLKIQPIRQIITATAFTDIQDLPGGGLYIRMWRNTQLYPFSPLGQEPLHQVPASVPVQEVTFKYTYVEGVPTPTELRIVSKERFGISGEHVETQQFVEEGPTLTSTTFLGEGISGQVIKKEIIERSGHGRRIWDYTVDRQKFEASTAADGGMGPLVLVGRTREVYGDYSPYEFQRREGMIVMGGAILMGPGSFRDAEGPNEGPGGKDGYRALMSFTDDVGGANLTTSYEYELAKDNTMRMKSVLYPDGSWQSYRYLDGPAAPAAAVASYSSWKDLSISQAANGVSVQTLVEGDAITRTTSVGGQVISKTNASTTTLANGDLALTISRFNGTDWLKEVRTYLAGTGRPGSIRHEDGTLTIYTYSNPVVPEELMVTKRTGAANPEGTAVISGEERRTTYNFSGEIIAEETSDVASGLLTFSRVADLGYGLDGLGRPAKWIYNGNPDDYEIERRTCCGLEFTRDRSGATVAYSLDGLKRVYRRVLKTSSSSPEVVVSTTYGGRSTNDGTIVTTTRSSGGVTLLVSEVTKNLLGEEIIRKSPDANGDGIPEVITTVTTHPIGTLGTPAIPGISVGDPGTPGTFGTPGNPGTTTVTYPDGSTKITKNYRDGRLKSVSGTAVPDVTYDYGTHAENGGGLWTKTTQANGTEWTKVYNDGLGRKFRTEYPDGSASFLAYHPTTGTAGSIGQLAATTDADGIILSYEYNAEGKLSSATEPMPDSQQRVTTTEDDVVNDPNIGTAARSRKWINGILVSTDLESADGYRSRSEVLGVSMGREDSLPADGSWTQATTGTGSQKVVKTFTEGRLQKSEFFDNQNQFVNSTSWTYDAFGRILTETDSRTGASIRNGYTEAGDLLSITDPGNRTTAYTYDAMGRRIAIDQPDSVDAAGNPLANITRTTYHPNGEIAAVWGDQTNATYRTYDEQSRLTGLRTYRNLGHGTQPLAGTGGYDLTSWAYHTQRGWMISKRDAADLGADYTYTSAGRLATRQWARTITGGTRLTTTYGYDAGTLVSTTYNDNLTPNVGYSYDSFGRQSIVTQQGDSWTFTYDPANLQLATETISYDTDGDGTGDFTRTLDRSYDLTALRSSGYEFKNGNIVETSAAYTYDAAGRLATVAGGSASSPQSFTYAYEPNSSALVHSVTGPVHTVTNTWESTRDVLAGKVNKVGSTVVSSYGYMVNDIGQRTALAMSGSAYTAPPSIQWSYNARGEVTGAAHSDNTQSRFYEFDAIGNRKKSRKGSSSDSGGILVNYAANNLDQYSAIDSRIPTHDADGNQLSGNYANDSSRGATYTWDGENRLVEAKVDGGTVGTYRYDPFGRRIYKDGYRGQKTWFFYDGWNLIAQHVGTVLTRSHLWGMDLSGGFQDAGGTGGLLCGNYQDVSLDGIFYPLFDGNGNATQYIDGSGTTVANFEYDAFGAVSSFQGSNGDFYFRFSTKQEDFETGLNYYGYRYYDPQQGRWPNRDPLEEEGGTNLYQMVYNDSLNWIDQLGLKITPCDDASKKALEELKKNSKKAKANIEQLENSKHEHKVKTTEGASGNKTNGDPRNTMNSGNGGGTTTSWNPNGHYGFSGNQVLSHELQHAADKDRGAYSNKDQDRNKVPDSEERAVDAQNDYPGPHRDGYGDKNADPNKTKPDKEDPADKEPEDNGSASDCPCP